jgi:hypothetical protein
VLGGQVIRYFVTTWKTDNTGYIVNNDQYTITPPLSPNCSYNFSVDWGDGTSPQLISSWDNYYKSHVYLSPGTYDVSISGLIGCFNFDHDADDIVDGDASKLINVKEWGLNQWESMEGMFYKADQLTERHNHEKYVFWSFTFQSSDWKLGHIQCANHGGAFPRRIFV